MSLLRFDDIGLEFGDQLILRDAAFSIEPGERVCLIGRNGAGKSTTLKLIMGSIEPDRGARQDERHRHLEVMAAWAGLLDFDHYVVGTHDHAEGQQRSSDRRDGEL